MRLSERIEAFRLKLAYTPCGVFTARVQFTFSLLKKYGLRYTLNRVYQYLKRRRDPEPSESDWVREHACSEAELAAQRSVTFDRNILFSVVVPLYNTAEPFLREMIDSVLSQTYPGWELCLADGSDEAHAFVGQICREYAEKDSRVRYEKLAENRGISENTNACLRMAKGDYIAALDHDDVLAPAALYKMMEVLCREDADVVYTDEARFLSPDLGRILSIAFKPDFGIDDLRANNYICHFTAYRRSLLDRVGLYRSRCDGSQDHDMMLRIAAVTDRFVHIPEVLYFWRAHLASTAYNVRVKSGASEAGVRAVEDHLSALGIPAQVESVEDAPTIYRIHYELTARPKVSIVIPTCDQLFYLKQCLESIAEKTTYDNYEIILVENNSKDPATFAYYKEAEQRWPRVKTVYWPGGWNWSAINNFGVKAAQGEYYLLLNNDIKVITPGWIEEMLSYAQRSDVGAVGAMLYFVNDTIQHAGVILGAEDGMIKPAHAFIQHYRGSNGFMGRLLYAQEYSAVTGACMLIPRRVWDEVGGIDEELAVNYSDVDLCLRIRQAGRQVVWTPHAQLYHYESRSRGSTAISAEKREQLEREAALLNARWGKAYASGDPYYNPNLSQTHLDFSLNE